MVYRGDTTALLQIELTIYFLLKWESYSLLSGDYKPFLRIICYVFMNYDQAQIVVQNNKHLIGSINERGFEVSDIIIVPSDLSLREQFVRLYMSNRDAVKSIQPFIRYDVEVWGIDTNHLFKANVLFFNVIER